MGTKFTIKLPAYIDLSKTSSSSSSSSSSDSISSDCISNTITTAIKTNNNSPVTTLNRNNSMTRISFGDFESLPLPTISTILKKVRILIVDDSRMNRKILKQLFSSIVGFDHECHECGDGTEAIDMIIKNKNINIFYDIILMDYLMVTMHGPDAVKIIRNELKFSGQIIGLTGNAFAEDLNTFINAGCNHVYVKPINIKHIKDIIKL